MKHSELRHQPRHVNPRIQDAGIWSSLVQEVIVKSKDDIRFIFKNGFEVRV